MKWNQFTANCAFIPYTFLLYVIPLYWSIVSLRISESPRAQRPHNYWQHNLSCPASHCHKISHGRPVKRQRQGKSRNRKIQSSTNNPSLLHPKTPYLICLQPTPPLLHSLWPHHSLYPFLYPPSFSPTLLDQFHNRSIYCSIQWLFVLHTISVLNINISSYLVM